jgi:anti-anti-sigma factor
VDVESLRQTVAGRLTAIRLECTNDRSVVWLSGEHDFSTSAALAETLDRVVSGADGDVVIDLGGVEFMGAATVGVIVKLVRSGRLGSRSLLVRSPSRSIYRILGLCGLGDALEPRPVDSSFSEPCLLGHLYATGPAGALGTWVSVPVRERAEPRSADEHSADEHSADEHSFDERAEPRSADEPEGS